MMKVGDITEDGWEITKVEMKTHLHSKKKNKSNFRFS